MAIAYHPLAIDQHITHLTVTTGKQPAVENGVIPGCGQVGVVAVEYQPIGALTHCQSTDRLAHCLRPSGQCRVKQRSADHGLVGAVHAVAALVAQALAVFQPAQLFNHAQRHMTVRADAQAAALGQVIHRREKSIPQIGFRGQAQPGYGLTVSHPRYFSRIGMGGVHQAPA